MPQNNPLGAVIGLMIGLIGFVVFGFVFFIPSIGFFFPVFSIFPIFFILVFIIIAVASSSTRRNQTIIKEITSDPRVNTQKINPYRFENTYNQTTTSQYQRIEEEKELKPKIRFCQYCGNKIEKEAIFCHNCGSKLE